MQRRTPALAAAVPVLLALASPASAVTHDFLTVTGNGVAGNAATSKFTSPNGLGWIDVTHSFSAPAGVGFADNNNTLVSSQFPLLFPGTGPVDGHLAMTVYNYQSVVTFKMSNYTISPADTIFGIWNITDEVAWPGGTAGGPPRPVYRLELLDSLNGVATPSMLLTYGNDQNASDVAGRKNLALVPATGELLPTTSIPGSIHTDALFLYNIPATTLEIRVYADLPPLNPVGDGVGYYFAEAHIPEPTALALLPLAALPLYRRRR